MQIPMSARPKRFQAFVKVVFAGQAVADGGQAANRDDAQRENGLPDQLDAAEMIWVEVGH